ncbi:MAG: alpha-glucan family phosphorylase [Gammaproteobacteria bacterium]|jgi:starch phosphorylase
MHAFFPRELPAGLQALADLALDLRWTWSHAGDELWRTVDPDTWERIENPWVIVQNVSQQRLEQLASDGQFLGELERLSDERRQYLASPGQFSEVHSYVNVRNIAYFSMEFGLGEALPLYAGGLGILAGDYLKAASDLGMPLVGVGLLYQEGYFRQMVDASGQQQAVYPFNDPTSLPIQPMVSPQGGWLHISLSFPGRQLMLRVWQVNVGRVTLYLLDSNDPLNTPADRGITGKLYGGGPEMRLIQEIVLGIGGWRLLETLGMEVDVCHLNEGHAAFAVLERARSYMKKSGMSFWEALWTTRAGNLFTTHTPVAAGFDRFSPELMAKYFPYFRNYLLDVGMSLSDILALGRLHPEDDSEPFNMAYLAMRGCHVANGVSQLHGEVSRQIFNDLYPRWPTHEVPVTHVTNGVHVPSWDSAWADQLWTRACGPDRWMGTTEALQQAIEELGDEAIWSFCAKERLDLIQHARQRLARQLAQRGADPQTVAQAEQVLDPNVLIVGFARRFAEYKRPNLLLHDRERLKRLLSHPEHPLQLIIAGKAHPDDAQGKALIKEWMEFVNLPEVRHHAVFLEDYDISLAQELVHGVDLWINTPRRPWEACGTSGMKALVNGGLNLSELDGWWAEAYAPEVGWALGDDKSWDGKEHNDVQRQAQWDAQDAQSLYQLLEAEVVPLFYRRDPQGIPKDWVARMRTSMARLAPQFSSNRMARDYIEELYLPLASAYHYRAADNGHVGRELYAWYERLRHHWPTLHFGTVDTRENDGHWIITAQVYLGDLAPEDVRVELYAELQPGLDGVSHTMQVVSEITGAVNGYFYRGEVSTERPAEHYVPRIVPGHSAAAVPMETALILWQR